MHCSFNIFLNCFFSAVPPLWRMICISLFIILLDFSHHNSFFSLCIVLYSHVFSYRLSYTSVCLYMFNVERCFAMLLCPKCMSQSLPVRKAESLKVFHWENWKIPFKIASDLRRSSCLLLDVFCSFPVICHHRSWTPNNTSIHSFVEEICSFFFFLNPLY